MSGLGYTLGTDLKRGRGRIGVTVALVAVLLGLALTAASGARRTDSAFTRMLQTYPGPDVIIPNVPDPSHTTAVFTAQQVLSVPGVQEVGTSKPLLIFVNGHPTLCVAHVQPDLGGPYVGEPAGRYHSAMRYKIVDGRQVDPNRLDEGIANYYEAQRLHLYVGETLPFKLAPPFDAILGMPGIKLPSVVHIVGIYAGPSEVFIDEQAVPAIHFSSALAQEYPPFIASSVLVKLKGGPSAVPAFLQQLDQRAHGLRVAVDLTHAGDLARQQAVHTEALAVWLLAGLVSLTGALIVVQTVIRQLHIDATNDPLLGALGFTRRQLWVKHMTRLLLHLTLGSFGAIGIMYVLSPLLPVGVARVADPNPGFYMDTATALLGALSFVVIASLVVAPITWVISSASLRRAGWKAVRSDRDGRRRGVLRRGPLTAILGATLAFDRRRGADALPTRTTVGAMVVAVAGLSAALVFVSSLDHLLARPNVYGLTWDAALGSPVVDARTANAALMVDRRIDGLAYGFTGVLFDVNGHAVDAELIDPPVKGSTGTVVLAGRAPVGPRELALGTRTMQNLHLHLGDTVRGGLPGTAVVPMKVVGRVVIVPSSTGNVTSNDLSLGDGVLASYSGIASLAPQAVPPPDAFLRFAPGVSPGAALDSLVAKFGGQFTSSYFTSPNDIITFGLLQNLPLILAGILGALALLTLVHMSLAGIARRRRDLAIFKTLGMGRGQLVSTLLWHSEWLAALAVVVGLLVGVQGGRWFWERLTTNIGIVDAPSVSVVSLLVAAGSIALLALLVALGPGVMAGRVRPARILRSE
jgi:hypothetical protein